MDRKILIIDDDARNIFALRAVLKARGFVCLTANSASEGLRVVGEEQDVGAVLLDMMMPEMDGYQALPIFLEKTARQTPIIAVTAQAMTGDREKCLEAGADGYISKPIDVDQLLALLDELMKE